MYRLISLIGAPALVTTALTTVTAPPAEAATWGPEVRIAYADRNDIYIAHPSGANRINITADVAAGAYDPSFSRSGRFVSYVTYSSGVQAWVYDFQTRKHTRVPVSSAVEFSPISDRLAYGEARSGVFDLFTINMDGTGRVNHTNEPAPIINGVPSFTADGTALVYSRNHGARVCRTDEGGFDHLHYAYRAVRLPLAGGGPVGLGGNDDVAISGVAEGGGRLAYVQSRLPANDGQYCASDPENESSYLMVNGTQVGEAWGIPPSVNNAGDVVYTAVTDAGVKVAVVPAGRTEPQVLFGGVAPDWGVAYAAPSDGCTIRGTSSDDRLNGTAGNDVICGYGGNDIIFGNGGDDVLRGGDGEDQMVGGFGNDRLYGEADNDVLRGDEGNDHLDGGTDVDLITYWTSRTRLSVDLSKRRATSASHGRDTTAGIESVFGSKTGDLIIGDHRSNVLYGGPGADVVKGGGGTDFLQGSASNDRMFGGTGNDLIEDLSGKDLLHGQAGKDACHRGRGNDRMRSCERVDTKDPKKAKGPRSGPDTGVASAAPAQVVSPQTVGGSNQATYWYVGNQDYLVVYGSSLTQRIGSLSSGTSAWESAVCGVVRFTPARGVCLTNTLNAVQKYQMQWFLWNAKRNGGCAIGILDWGRHGVNQFKKRWKVRSATFYRHNVAIPWVTPGSPTYVKVGKGYLTVNCR